MLKAAWPWAAIVLVGVAGCAETGPPAQAPTTDAPAHENSCHGDTVHVRLVVVNWATDRVRDYNVTWTVGGQDISLQGRFTPEAKETFREEGPYPAPYAGNYSVVANADGVVETFQDRLRCDGRVRLWATWDLDGWRFTTDNAVQ